MDKEKDYYEIDLGKVFKALWKKLWLIVIVTLICAIAAFMVTTQFMTPKYKATALLYVNNSSVSLGQTRFSISSSDIYAAQSLVETYSVIVKTRIVLEDVINLTNSNRTYNELRNMVTTSSMNETEIIAVTVESEDPVEARVLANSIATLLPDKIAGIIEGASVKLVEYAVTPDRPSSPNVSRNTGIGGLLGLILICLIIGIRSILDNKIHDENYLIETYDIPVLATIPDLTRNRSGNRHAYYYYYQQKTTGQGNSGILKKNKKNK